MAEAVACVSCDAHIDGIAEAQSEGWADITADPEGYSWNYLGVCPDCRAENV
jgi:hypothetical protein